MKHTKKQISEAIKYWQGILKKMNESNGNFEKYKIRFNVDRGLYTKSGRFIENMDKAHFRELLMKIEKKYDVQANIINFPVVGNKVQVEFIGEEDTLEYIYRIWYDESFEKVFSNAMPVSSNQVKNNYF